MGVYLICVYLTGVHLTGVHLMGVYLIGVYLMGLHFIGVHLTGMLLMGVYLIGVHLMGVHLTGVHLMGVYLTGTWVGGDDSLGHHRCHSVLLPSVIENDCECKMTAGYDCPESFRNMIAFTHTLQLLTISNHLQQPIITYSKQTQSR